VKIIFTPLAKRHLDSLHQYITSHASEERTDKYADRIVAFCKSLTTFPMCGAPRDDLLPGLRVTGFDRRVTIAFIVTEFMGSWKEIASSVLRRRKQAKRSFMGAAWQIPIAIVFVVMLGSARAGNADAADSKAIRNGETYSYRGTFNYYYPSPTPSSSQAGQQFSRNPAPSSELLDLTGISTLIVAIFTAALFITSLLQWRVAIRGLPTRGKLLTRPHVRRQPPNSPTSMREKSPEPNYGPTSHLLESQFHPLTTHRLTFAFLSETLATPPHTM